MPGGAGGYLPPVLASLIADDEDAIRKIAEVKAALEDLEKTPTDVKVTADTSPAISEVEAARAAMEADPVTLTVTADTAPALASIAASRAAGGALGAGAGGSASGGGGGFLAGLLGAGLLGGGGRGVGNTLGFGGGGIGPIPGARWGSAASLAGFGAEHIITTLMGLGGSATEALGGGALLGAGSLGTMAVGSGSDMAVMKSTIADTQTLSKLYTQLQKDVIQYGAGSAQAAADQKNLNVEMQVLGNTAGVQAEMALTKSAAALNAFWDQQTSGARVAATNIMQQVVTLGTVYTPLVAAAAERNLTIINDSLKPLFAWLEGPQGIAIFKDLENAFAANLPNAMAAFTNGVEFVLKTLDLLSLHTGGITAKIGDLLAKANSPEGFAKWESVMSHMIDVWHAWEALIVIAAQDLVLLFKPSVGLGTSIVGILDQMLMRLHVWLASTSGQTQLHSLFQAHLDEIKNLLALLPGLFSSFGQIYLTIAPALTEIVALIAQFVGWLSKIPVVGPILEWGIAIAILANRMKLFTFAEWIAGLIRMGAAFVTMAGEAGIGAAVRALLGFGPAADAAKAATVGLGAAAAVAAGEEDALAGSEALAGTAAATAAGEEDALAGAETLVGGAGAGASTGAGGLIGALGALTAAGGLAPVIVGLAGALGQLNSAMALMHSQGDTASWAAPGGLGITVPFMSSGTAVGGGAFANLQDMLNNSSGQGIADMRGFLSDLHSMYGISTISVDQLHLIANAVQSGAVQTKPQFDAFLAKLGLLTGAAAAAANSEQVFAALQQNGLLRNQVQQDMFHTLWDNGTHSAFQISLAMGALGRVTDVTGQLSQNEQTLFAQLWHNGVHDVTQISQAVLAERQVFGVAGPQSSEAQQFFLQQWQKGNQDMGNLTAGVAALTAVEQNVGPITGQRLQAFETLWGNGVTDATTLSKDMNALMQVSAITGPLSATAMQIFLTDVQNGVTNANTIASDIAKGIPSAGQIPGANQGLLTAIQNAENRYNHLLPPGYTGGVGLGAQHGIVGNFGSGTPIMVHGVEAILAKDRTDPALWQMAVASIQGRAVRPATVLASTPASSSAVAAVGGHTLQISAPITIHVPNTNASPHQIGDAAEQAVNRAWSKVLRSLGGGAYSLQPA